VDDLAELVRLISLSPKYRAVCPEFIESVGRVELAKRHNLREAVKAAKSKLHQVGGAYLEGEASYAQWLEALRAASDREALKTLCRKFMTAHASTRERLVILDRFYEIIWAGRPPVQSVLDLACGLNPLAIPWMPLAEGAAYFACDIYQDMIAFLGQFMRLPLAAVHGQARARDVLQTDTLPAVDLVLALKTFPCLEQVDKNAGARLLDKVQAKHLVVSFPVHSLGKREKGMIAHYDAHFRGLWAGRPGQIRRFDFVSELVYLVSFQPSEGGTAE
jgi:16S rRNA (guanine(1405)-N(7))-methyltransferase